MKKRLGIDALSARHLAYLIPVLGLLWVWLTSLSFVPVPWPDDSAFYFPAKDLFAWPPRWVMMPQAPFEPSYREWNFNTMPLFPILIGIARLAGMVSTHALKLLPLAGWLGGVLFILHQLRKAGASAILLMSVALVFTFDPILRWSSVLVRPESIIGAMGVFILFGARFGWPNVLRERKYFHPAALALLVGALLHFNAIHLVPLVIVLYWPDFRKITKIGALTAMGLIPWLITIVLKPALFVRQMELQFNRLTGYHNPWLTSWDEFTKALLTDMGTPEPWALEYRYATIAAFLFTPVLIAATGFFLKRRTPGARSLLAAGIWLFSAFYLWHTKAEVWFTHYFHLAFWAWVALVLFELREFAGIGRKAALIPLAIGCIFLYGQMAQTVRLEASETWHWRVYGQWIDCIDGFLSEEYARLGNPKRFRVWDPTFPDITIALSQRHPDWEFTRTNDFYSRADLAVRHGYDVEAVVVPELFRNDEKIYRGPLSARPEARSVWMGWDGYFLSRLERDPKFKPRRFLCQNGRWDAFIYLNP